MIGVVIDTNVMVSANISDEGLEAFVVSLALSGQVRLYVSEPILQEYQRVLSYTRLKFLPRDIERFMDKVRQSSTNMAPAFTIHECPHEPDNRFLECAEDAQADFLITGNTRHFPARFKQTSIVNARQFLEQAFPRTE